MPQQLRLIKGKHQCPHCVFRKFFLDAGIDCQHLDEIGESATKSSGPYAAGDLIYRTGDACDSLYVVQSGSVKLEMNTEEGDAHVSGFYLTGEMFGADGISTGVFPSSAIALERTTVCSIKLSRWEAMSTTYPAMQTSLVNEMAEIVRHKSNEMMCLHHLRVEDRVINFLRHLLERVRTRRGQSIRTVPPSMCQMDIARYLGTTPETLSRSLKKLEAAGVICRRGRHIELVEVDDWHKNVGA